MTKKILLVSALLLSMAFSLQAANHTATNATILQSGVTRDYRVYVSNTYTASKPAGILVLLHGFGQTKEAFDAQIDAYNVPTAHNVIVIAPQARPEQNTEIINLNTMAASQGYTAYDLSSVWNCGLSVPLDSLLTPEQKTTMSAMSAFIPNIWASQKLVFNATVPDNELIDALIAKVKSDYTINNDRIFMLGYSLGGSMCYNYLFNGGGNVKAMVSIYGFLGREVNTTGSVAASVCHFHSRGDAFVKFNGGQFNNPIMDMMTLLATKNGYSTTPVATSVPDTKADGITVKTYDYSGAALPRLKLYEMDNAQHEDILNGTTNDIDFITEAWKFFDAVAPETTSVENASANNFTVLPNPATDYVIAPATGTFALLDLTGRTVQSGFAEQGVRINLQNLPAGMYVLQMQAGKAKIMVK